MKRLLVKSQDIPTFHAHGVPHTVLTSRDVDPVEFCQTLDIDKGDSVKHIRVTEQRRVFAQTCKYPTKVPYLYVIGSKTTDAIAKIAAFCVFKAALAESTQGASPYWHTILGNYQDQLRDDENYRAYTVGTPSLLVLSNIATNSSSVKFDKVRDLLEMYGNIPRIVIVQGEDPLTFCARHLFVSCNRLMYFP